MVPDRVTRNRAFSTPSRPLYAWLLLAGLLVFSQVLQAGSFIGAGESRGVDLIMHPEGYTGTPGELNLNICVVAGTTNEALMVQSVKNIASTFNKLQATTGNRRPGFVSGIDFESVALHEVGHCLGLGHVNAASESGLSGSDREYTKATNGANGFDLDNGADNVKGSGDDDRTGTTSANDDVNMHWFRKANNNPVTIDYDVVDSTTYSVSVADLPAGHSFAANADRTVATDILDTPNTEAVMQQGTYTGEIQRTLSPDGVATLKYGMSGEDEIQNITDDYTIKLNYATSNCDLNLQFGPTADVGLAYCSVGFTSSQLPSGHRRITSAEMFFGDTYTWHFNTATPCSESISLPQNQWKMFSPPCLLGISTGDATVADILGAGLVYGTNVIIHKYDAAAEAYVQLLATSELQTGEGYFVYTDQAGKTLDFDGQFNASPDIPLTGTAGGRFNLVGHPWDFSVDWDCVQIVDGAEVQSLSAAADTDNDLPGEYHIWNGSAYQVFGGTPGFAGTLNKGDGIWVEANKDIRLRIPYKQSACTASGSVGLEAQSENTGAAAAAGSPARHRVDKVVQDGSWYVRIIAESGDHIDPGNVLGQLPESLDGLDKHDLEELQPFGNSYLTVTFPHEEWGTDAWAYTSDYRAVSRKPGGYWEFAVRSSADVTEASLRFEGPSEILKKAQIRDLETGKRIKLADGAYWFPTSPGIRYFSFRLGKK